MPIENGVVPFTVRESSTPAVAGSASIAIALGGPGVDVTVGDDVTGGDGVVVAELGTGLGVGSATPVPEQVIVASVVVVLMLADVLLIVVVALWYSGAWERRVIREQLASEIGRAVTPDEYQSILQDGALRTRRIISE